MTPEHSAVTEGASQTGLDRHLPGECQAVGSVLSRVGDKWTVLTVMMLASGPRRFNELKRMIGGISQRMLTLTLRGLERDGIVTRTLYPTIPPRVDYELTELGQSLRGPIEVLGNWTFAHLPIIEQARRDFDAREDAQPHQGQFGLHPVSRRAVVVPADRSEQDRPRRSA